MHSRSTTVRRRPGATPASAEITSGTLPKGSMTSSSSTAAEKNSVDIGLLAHRGLVAHHDAFATRVGAADPSAWRSHQRLDAAGVLDDHDIVPERAQLRRERDRGRARLELGRT